LSAFSSVLIFPKREKRGDEEKSKDGTCMQKSTKVLNVSVLDMPERENSQTM
jgi:hypothetical protein